LRTWFPIRRGVFSRIRGYVRAVDGVSLAVHEGETLALVGESGCGKSTLARTVLRLDPAREGSVHFEGRDLLAGSERSIRPWRRKLQMIFQDTTSSLNPRMTVLGLVTEAMVEHGLIRASEREAHAVRLLNDVGLSTEALHRYPHEFSGGQRQRIALARAVSLRPRMILCDEPVSALDVSVQAQVINLLMDLKTAYGLSYIFISHDLSVVRHIADRTAVMYLGRIVEHGATADVIDHPRHPYTRALISAVPRVRVSKPSRILLPGDVPSPARPPPGCPFHPRCPFAGDLCRRQVPTLEPCEGEQTLRRVACIRRNEI
jgi:oligopeptide/dipeptide ABC transporter ATP-binding protein